MGNMPIQLQTNVYSAIQRVKPVLAHQLPVLLVIWPLELSSILVVRAVFRFVLTDNLEIQLTMNVLLVIQGVPHAQGQPLNAIPAQLMDPAINITKSLAKIHVLRPVQLASLLMLASTLYASHVLPSV